MKAKFNSGDRVSVNGRDGEHVIYRSMIIMVPTITNGKFEMIDTLIYKFNPYSKDEFYAHEKDLLPLR